MKPFTHARNSARRQGCQVSKRKPYTARAPITQVAERFNGTPRHERRKLDAQVIAEQRRLARAAARREAKQRGDRTDQPTGPLSAPTADTEQAKRDEEFDLDEPLED